MLRFPAPLSGEAYREKIDPALDAILKYKVVNPY